MTVVKPTSTAPNAQYALNNYYPQPSLVEGESSNRPQVPDNQQQTGGGGQTGGQNVTLYKGGQTISVPESQVAALIAQGWSRTPPSNNPNPTPTSPPPNVDGNGVQIVPGVPQGNSQINVADAAGQFVTNPSLLINQDDPSTPGINESMELSDRVPTVSQSGINSGTIDPNDPAYNQANGPTAGVAQGQTSNVPGMSGDPNAVGVDTALANPAVAANQTEAAQGTVSNQSQIDPNAGVIDGEATAAGTNGTGQALKEAAIQNISNIIDTSTSAGKLLAEQLGEGNYTDAKATLKGQLEILQGEFFDAQGNPRIPIWATASARNVQKIAAFKGMTGTAATAALATAMMEASLPIAQADAQFFQTLTVKNLDNRQEATINRANILSKIDMQNADARLAAAVQNSQAFLQMDMANLDNEQQANVIDSQARIQSLLEDAKAENAGRLFVADSQNEKDKFYSQLEAQINQFVAAQNNAMSQFNAGETNSAEQFNADLENSRQEFYKNMQFNIDTANAKWRQTVTMTENQQKFEAAATDVKNLVGISVEQLNQIWDRADALLDYAWKSADNEADRKNQLALVALQGKLAGDAADAEGFGSILGSILGAGASALFGWLF